MKRRRYSEDPKRIRLDVEWIGACGEANWCEVVKGAIEEADASGTSRVVRVEALTSQGETTPIPHERLRMLGYDPRPRGGSFWAGFFWRLRGLLS